MKKVILLLLVIFSTNTYATNWIESIEDAQKMALATNKLIVVDFWATWCGPCRKMDAESWADPEVSKLMQNFIPVKVNISNDKRTASKYNVSSIPDVFIMNGNGDVIYHHVGYLSKDKVLKLLKEYSLETSFVQKEAINYFKHKSYNTAFLLGRKYLDYSMFFDGDLRVNFSNLASQYLKESQKMLDKEQKNYAIMNQKIELLQLAADLYSGKNRVNKKLERNFKESEISEHNKRLYYYLNYCCAKYEEDGTDEEWLAKLTAINNHEVFLQKAELFLASKK